MEVLSKTEFVCKLKLRVSLLNQGSLWKDFITACVHDGFLSIVQRVQPLNGDVFCIRFTVHTLHFNRLKSILTGSLYKNYSFLWDCPLAWKRKENKIFNRISIFTWFAYISALYKAFHFPPNKFSFIPNILSKTFIIFTLTF